MQSAADNLKALNDLLVVDPDAELFADVDDTYQVSNLGRVRHKASGRVVSVYLHDGGYWRVGLNSRLWYVHVLVAKAFVVPKDSNPRRIVVDHIDGDKNRYRWDNLRWLTHKENTEAHYALSEKAMRLIMCDKDGTEIGRYASTTHCIRAHPKLALQASGISKCCRGTMKAYKRHIFRYEVGSGGRVRHTPRELHPDEVFRNVGEFEGKDFSDYEISSYGLLRNVRGIYLTPVEPCGYYAYQLSLNGQKVEVRAHRLVAHAFCDGRTPARNIVHHKDANRKNNHYSNLAWCTQQENTEFSRARPVDHLTLDGVFVATYRSMAVAARAVGTSPVGICNACSGKQHTAGGFKWRYAQAV